MLLKILAYAAILIWGWIAIAQVIVWARKAKRTEGSYEREDYKRRNDRTDAQKEGADMTTVVVKLETISSGVNEIKADLRNVREPKHRLRSVSAADAV